MAYEILENKGVDITNLDGAVFNRLSTGGNWGVIAGYMNECQMYADGNKVVLSTGCLLIGGIRIKITENEVFTMQSSPTSNTDYGIVCEIQRLSTDSGFTVNFNISGTEPVIPNDDIINGTGTVRFVVGSFTHTTSGAVTNVKRQARLLVAQDIYAALSDYYTKSDIESILDSEFGAGVPELLWSGKQTLTSGYSDYLDAASMYPELFEETGLFALMLEVMPDPNHEGTPFITTVLIDTEGSGPGSANFSGVAFGGSMYSIDKYGGKLAWGNIDFSNYDGYVKFYDAYFYDFTEVEIEHRLTPTELTYIDILSIHRISRTAD